MTQHLIKNNTTAYGTELLRSIPLCAVVPLIAYLVISDFLVLVSQKSVAYAHLQYQFSCFILFISALRYKKFNCQQHVMKNCAHINRSSSVHASRGDDNYAHASTIRL